MCEHRRLAALLAQVGRPDLPGPIARDGVRHTWESYSVSLRELILDCPGNGWIAEAEVPVVLVAGERDPVVDVAHLTRLAERHPNLRVVVRPGDHELPLTDPEWCREQIEAALTRGGAALPL